jgi:hypothetical protein
MQNNPIVINEEYLKKLQREYAELVDQLEKLDRKVYRYGNLPESNVDITQQFKLRFGGAKFSEGLEAATRINEIREGLVQRLKRVRAELYTLEHGVKFLLNDSDAVEQLTTLSSEQFEYFMPKSAGM